MIDRNTPSLPEAVDARVDRKLRALNTVAVGRIESYDDSSGRASVQLIVERVEYGEDGERTTTKRPVLVEVPVGFQGSGQRRVKFPISSGDVCLVLFCQHSLDRWLATGGNSVDPGDERAFHLSDAIALTGLDRELEDAATYIEVTDAKVDLGGGATEAAIKGNAYRSAEDTMLTSIAAFLTAYAASPTGAGAAATAAATAIDTFKAAAASYLATKVKVI